jgi:hypothetical protein
MTLLRAELTAIRLALLALARGRRVTVGEALTQSLAVSLAVTIFAEETL